jgi:Bacterial Ig-like domain (group 2)/WD40-like Beta Propeller Repeat
MRIRPSSPPGARPHRWSARSSFVLAASFALCAPLGAWGLGGCTQPIPTGFPDDPTPGGDLGDADTATGPLFSGDGGAATGALLVSPSAATVNAVKPGPVATQTFQAATGTTTATATWSIDNPALGTIDNTGVFKASGNAAGTATVTARVGSLTATAALAVHLKLTDDPGNVATATQTALNAGGHADAAFRWLYPYDKTVFPRGLTAPVLQFDGEAPTAVRVHVTSKNLDYQGYYAGSSPAQVTMSAATWLLVTTAAGSSDPVRIDVTKASAAGVTGPTTETWTIAQGGLTGTVYYNTYDSTIAAGGAVMRIKPGTPAQVLLGNCTTCHAVSADGSTLVANANDQNDQSYALGQDAGVMASVVDGTWSFGGVYPNGSLVLQSGGGEIPGTSGLVPSRLFDTKTGQPVAAPGFDGVVDVALMPSFSPDGKKVAFSNYDAGNGHSLSVMNFDVASKTFSGLVDVATTADQNDFLGWPAFVPTSTAFLFGHIDNGDFATWNQHHGDLSIADVASKTAISLDALNGIAAGQAGTVYLPYGDSEAHLNYEPTVLPIAVGGYYWTVFTSRREYGNTITDADPWESGPARRKKLWIAAIDQDIKAGTDPSHPAFYLNDQEVEAGNMRGFWALDPCAQNGASCATGDQCCTGFCRAGSAADGGAALVCVAPPATGCAQEYEKCSATSACCGASAGFQCVNGYCAQPAPK